MEFGNHWSKDAPNPKLAAKNKRSKADMCREVGPCACVNAVPELMCMQVGASILIDDSVSYAFGCAARLRHVCLFGHYAW